MAALIQSTSNVEATYEDMFKEITRKLYGEETGNGLHTLGTPMAQVATTGPTAPEGERSFTNLQIDQSSAPTIEYEHNAGAVAQEGIGGLHGSTGNVATVTAAAVAAAAAAHMQQQQQQQQQQQRPEGLDSVGVGNESAAGGGSANFKSEDHLGTAFGLAALMQNGFTQNTANILGAQQQQQQQQNINKTVNQQQQPQHDLQQQQQRWGNTGNGGTNDEGATEPVQILHWTSAGKLQNFNNSQPQQQQQHQQSQQQQQVTHLKPKAKNRNDQLSSAESANELIFTSPPTTSGASPQASSSNNLSSIQTNNNKNGCGGNRKKSQNANQLQAQQQQAQTTTPKRYACTHCPYSTDRRDLYTRHENIHKDEKPFQCYACLKQFNRADHVKKHFLRMHRELQYDINKTRRNVSNSSNTGTGHQQRNSVTSCSSSSGSPEQKPNIFHAANVQLENAFLQNQTRQTTASSMSIAETIEAVARAADSPLPQMKQEKCDDMTANMLGGVSVGVNIGIDGGSNQQQGSQISNKPKREKRFTCMYCSWSGADKWGLKRHLNTHTKPFVCLLCDYKAARSERLATHILKVHNKRACNKCAFLADTQEEYQVHINEVHPHDNRPSRQNNNSNSSSSTNNSQNNFNNVLCSIGSSLISSNNQLNNFPNPAAFGVGNNNVSTNNMGNTSNTGGGGGGAGGAVTIYTTTTTTTTNEHGILGSGGNNISTGGPLQEIIVNPTSMVGWRLSANGSLIPPHDILSGGMPTAAAQKRGSERLFQYLEADGSDPEDYARLLKMDAISRNTASVAQDFHKAGGVQELKIPANQQLLFDNKLLNQWTTKEAAALLQSLSNSHIVQQHQQQQSTQQHKYRMQQLLLQQQQQMQQNNLKRKRHHSTGEDDENTPSSSSSTTSSNDGEMLTSSAVSPIKLNEGQQNRGVATTAKNILAIEQKKAMSTFLSKNFDLKEAHLSSSSTKSSNDITTTITTGTDNNYKKRKNQHQQQQHNNNNNKLNDHKNIENDEDQENQEQLIKSPPAYNFKYNNHNNNNNSKNNKIQQYYNNINNSNYNNNNHYRQSQQNQQQQQQPPQPQQTITQKHRLDLYKDNKENKIISTTIETNTVAAAAAAEAAVNFLTTLEFQNMNNNNNNNSNNNSSKIGTHLENYVKEIISKYYAVDMPQNLTLTSAASSQLQQEQNQQEPHDNSPFKRKRILSETEEYIEYLKNKSDITLTITPKISPNNQRKSSIAAHLKQRHSVDILPSNSTNHSNNKNQKNNINNHNNKKLDLDDNKNKFNNKHQDKNDEEQLNPPPSTTTPTSTHDQNKPARKSLSQLATLLPLLADAASKQQYLATPLDFSKKSHSLSTKKTSPTAEATTTSITTKATSESQNYDINEATTASTTMSASIASCNKRKQAQPKKKIRPPPEVIVALLRDKYLNRMVNQKLSCRICASNRQSFMLVFNYHTKGSLALHRLWKHKNKISNKIKPKIH